MTMYDAIVLAGGSGLRSGLTFNKVFDCIHGQWVITYSLDIFEQDPRCERIILVRRLEDKAFTDKLTQYRKLVVTTGGKTRLDSVKAGLNHVHANKVLIHDGARPAIDVALIDRLLAGLNNAEAVTPGVAIHDTVKRVKEGRIIASVSRDQLMKTQTPQAFITPVISQLHAQSINEHYTCDVSLYEAQTGKKARVVDGDKKNVKYTTAEDKALLELILND